MVPKAICKKRQVTTGFQMVVPDFNQKPLKRLSMRFHFPKNLILANFNQNMFHSSTLVILNRHSRYAPKLLKPRSSILPASFLARQTVSVFVHPWDWHLPGKHNSSLCSLKPYARAGYVSHHFVLQRE